MNSGRGTVRNEEGLALVLLVILVALTGILATAATQLFINQARQTQLRIDQTKARYLAECGVQSAVWAWFESNATETDRRYDPGSATVTGNNLFKTGVDADFALYSFDAAGGEDAGFVRADGGACTQGSAGADACVKLQGFRIRNLRTVDSGAALTLARCKVTWSPAGGEAITEIKLNDTSVYGPGGSAASGTDIDIQDATIDNDSFIGNGAQTYIQWDGEPGGGSDVTVTVQWTFSDDADNVDSKSHEVVYWNGAKDTGGGRPAQHTFQITSTGQVEQTTAGYFKVLKTARAVVAGNVANPEIVRWDEIDKNIP